MSGAAVTRGVGWPLKAVRQALREALYLTTVAAAGAINNGEFTRGRTSEAWGGAENWWLESARAPLIPSLEQQCTLQLSISACDASPRASIVIVTSHVSMLRVLGLVRVLEVVLEAVLKPLCDKF
jgi:hypothetical protein